MKTLLSLILLLIAAAPIDVTAQGTRPNTLAALAAYRGADRAGGLVELVGSVLACSWEKYLRL